jgi:AbrB family looped-hinge helix DNA binding protein
MSNIYTSVIRDRGQLTIPDKIRESLDWASPNSVVTIISDKSDEITIRPHQSQKKVDWDKIWKGIKASRAIKGKGKTMSAAEFLEQDRRSH